VLYKGTTAPVLVVNVGVMINPTVCREKAAQTIAVRVVSLNVRASAKAQTMVAVVVVINRVRRVNGAINKAAHFAWIQMINIAVRTVQIVQVMHAIALVFKDPVAAEMPANTVLLERFV
jgi:hypothetical protein